jgi:hypothetical protein
MGYSKLEKKKNCERELASRPVHSLHGCLYFGSHFRDSAGAGLPVTFWLAYNAGLLGHPPLTF